MYALVAVTVAILMSISIYSLNKFIDDDKEAYVIETGSWLMFSVLFALLPVIFYAVWYYMNSDSLRPEELVSRGELLIVSAGIAAHGAGKVIVSKDIPNIYRIFGGGSCIILLLVSSFAFANVASSALQGSPLDSDTVHQISWIVFPFTSVASGACVLSAVGE